ncbi:SURF1 family protein [Streptomyces spirodelae]|uniref:SURF1-like protein n=1 Tax=Streptomyces spirodelae TaxID=2812904 RepID=A0ABS3WWL8_9ACTN|nr:SURF1 family protein [Streptomyces spirodelae]MBO8187464.1 SURF1 family protein [Streptomyces spirodelae]
MYRFLLTPRWWAINIFAVLAIPVCVLMGSWQLSRFDDRVDRHQEQQEQSGTGARAAARPLEKLLPVTQDTVGRTAEVTGRFDTAHPLLVPDRTVEGKRGFYVLSLLRTGQTNGGQTNGGKALPVVRGWLPGEPDPDRVPAAPKGKVTVRGVLQAPESHSDAGQGASGGLPDGQLGYVSAATLVNVVPYDVEEAWITEQRTERPLRPVPPVAPDNTGLDMKAFQNLGYTAQWFVFAGFAVFMWFRFFRREAEMAKDAALGLIPGDRPDGPEADAGPPGPSSEGAAARNRSPA